MVIGMTLGDVLLFKTERLRAEATFEEVDAKVHALARQVIEEYNLKTTGDLEMICECREEMLFLTGVVGLYGLDQHIDAGDLMDVVYSMLVVK